MKQLSLKNQKTEIPMTKKQTEFGGSLLKGRRKTRRPICTRRPIHLVLKSNRIEKEFRTISFTKIGAKVRRSIRRQASLSKVKVYSTSVNYNHLHMAIKVKHRSQYLRFVRGLSAHLVSLVKIKGLFDLRPFTRIVEWGLAFRRLLSYVEKNRVQSGEDQLCEWNWSREKFFGG